MTQPEIDPAGLTGDSHPEGHKFGAFNRLRTHQGVAAIGVMAGMALSGAYGSGEAMAQHNAGAGHEIKLALVGQPIGSLYSTYAKDEIVATNTTNTALRGVTVKFMWGGELIKGLTEHNITIQPHKSKKEKVSIPGVEEENIILSAYQKGKEIGFREYSINHFNSDTTGPSGTTGATGATGSTTG